MDKTIFLIRSKPEYLNEWKKAPAFRFRTGIVFLTATELRNYSGKQNADYCDLDVCRPMVLRYQGELAAHVSGAFLNELLRKRAENALSDFEAEVFASIQAVVGLMMQKEHRYGLIEDLLNLLESLPGDCPAYMQSPEYRLKISRKYENKKHHGTFFFGG